VIALRLLRSILCHDDSGIFLTPFAWESQGGLSGRDGLLKQIHIPLLIRHAQFPPENPVPIFL
jgi:hypothetical protein